ncbi:hypothetical protein C8J56DRAFT_979617 [Mycena floridula]|nr:hypothetical protein C8J56DRAFT_979617 [Mycena floridula]
MSIDSSTPSSRISSPSPPSTMSETNTPPSLTASSSATSLVALPSMDGSDSSLPLLNGSRSSSVAPLDAPTGPGDIGITSEQSEVDQQILEALKSKDRLYVLKLGEQMESLINDRRARIELTPATSYQRLLVHRCSAYYRLLIENDPTSKSITVLPTPDCFIPARRLADLVPLETAAQPAFKIMRRNMDRTKPTSQTGSVTGEDADLSDVEPSEAGSLGGRTTKKHRTMEERSAAYQRARDRIFKDEEKKEKEMTTSLASLSLGSASSSSQAGGSSVGDLDETSSVTAESEQSGPSVGRENKDIRRSGSSSGQPSTSRILRPSAPVFSSSGSASSRDSRSSSPSFTYATLYEPAAPQAPPFDPNTGQPFAPAQYLYHYPPGQPMNSQFVPQYGYYPYPFPGQPTTDPVSPTSATEMYPPMHYGPYLWPQAQHPQAMSAPNLAPQGQTGGPSQIHSAPVTQPQPNPALYPPQHQYIQQSPLFSYPMSGYYTPQPNQQHIMPQPPINYESPRSMNGVFIPANNTNLANGGNHYPRRNNGHTQTMPPALNGGNKGRPLSPPPQPRQAWSFGPGVGNGGHTYNASTCTNSSVGEVVGPRFSTMRRLSNNSVNGNGSMTSRNSSNWDEVSSTASSSTSSSSRRTFTSTSSSSQHPLPPRPDWAVGLKPDATLHATSNRHHDQHGSSSRNSNNMAQQMSPRNGSSSRHQRPPVSLASTDFPPLSTTESHNQKRTPTAHHHQHHHQQPMIYQSNGAPIMNGIPMMNPMMMPSRLEETDRGFERPPAKAAELYNPKIPLKRPVGPNGRQSSQEKPARSSEGGAISIEDVGPDGST